MLEGVTSMQGVKWNIVLLLLSNFLLNLMLFLFLTIFEPDVTKAESPQSNFRSLVEQRRGVEFISTPCDCARAPENCSVEIRLYMELQPWTKCLRKNFLNEPNRNRSLQQYISILAADPLPPPKPMLFNMLPTLFIGNSDWVDGH